MIQIRIRYQILDNIICYTIYFRHHTTYTYDTCEAQRNLILSAYQNKNAHLLSNSELYFVSTWIIELIHQSDCEFCEKISFNHIHRLYFQRKSRKKINFSSVTQQNEEKKFKWCISIVVYMNAVCMFAVLNNAYTV